MCDVFQTHLQITLATYSYNIQAITSCIVKSVPHKKPLTALGKPSL